MKIPQIESLFMLVEDFKCLFKCNEVFVNFVPLHVFIMPTLRKRKTNENPKQSTNKELERKVGKECEVIFTRGSSKTRQNGAKGEEKKTRSVEKIPEKSKGKQKIQTLDSEKESNLKKVVTECKEIFTRGSLRTRQNGVKAEEKKTKSVEKISEQLNQKNQKLEGGKESNLKKTQSAIKQPKEKQIKPKQVQVKENKCKTRQNTPKSKVLRTRRDVKYAESSLEVSQINNSAVSKKVPIYKQQVFDDKNKRKGDQYEFDSDTEKNKKRKRMSDDSFKEYDKTIKRIANAVNKTEKRQKKVIFADKNDKNVKVPKKKLAEKDENVKVPKKKLAESLLKSPSQINILSNQPKQIVKKVFNQQCQNKENPDSSVKFEPDCTNPKIQLISNVLLKPNNELNMNVASPDFDFFTKPDANSTMIDHVSPWRFDDVCIRRNPHFIRVKPSSLPSVDQEMVLDHTVVDKFETLNASHIQNTPTRKSPRKVQSKISSFVLREHNDNQSNVQNVSIFSNLSDSFSPRPKSPEKRDHLDFTTFGFSDDENDKENLNSPVKNKENRPFRVSINVNDKKYERKRKVQFKRTETLPSSDEESDEEIAGGIEGHGRLFEDVEDVNSKKDALEKVEKVQAGRKKGSKNKPKDYDSIHHIRKKDVRTKQEEEEAEKWAAAFNSLCEEIEKFPLEIE